MLAEYITKVLFKKMEPSTKKVKLDDAEEVARNAAIFEELLRGLGPEEFAPDDENAGEWTEANTQALFENIDFDEDDNKENNVIPLAPELAYPAHFPYQGDHKQSIWNDIRNVYARTPGMVPAQNQLYQNFLQVPTPRVVMVFSATSPWKPQPHLDRRMINFEKTHGGRLTPQNWEAQGVLVLVHPAAAVYESLSDLRLVFEGLLGLQLQTLIRRDPIPSIVLCGRTLWGLTDTLPRKSRVILTFEPCFGQVPVTSQCPLKIVNRQLKDQKLDRIQW